MKTDELREMKVDELIEILEAMRRAHGNLPVKFNTEDDGIREVFAWTERGYYPCKKHGKAAEIVLY